MRIVRSNRTSLTSRSSRTSRSTDKLLIHFEFGMRESNSNGTTEKRLNEKPRAHVPVRDPAQVRDDSVRGLAHVAGAEARARERAEGTAESWTLRAPRTSAAGVGSSKEGCARAQASGRRRRSTRAGDARDEELQDEVCEEGDVHQAIDPEQQAISAFMEERHLDGRDDGSEDEREQRDGVPVMKQDRSGEDDERGIRHAAYAIRATWASTLFCLRLASCSSNIGRRTDTGSPLGPAHARQRPHALVLDLVLELSMVGSVLALGAAALFPLSLRSVLPVSDRITERRALVAAPPVATERARVERRDGLRHPPAPCSEPLAGLGYGFRHRPASF